MRDALLEPAEHAPKPYRTLVVTAWLSGVGASRSCLFERTAQGWRLVTGPGSRQFGTGQVRGISLR